MSQIFRPLIGAAIAFALLTTALPVSTADFTSAIPGVLSYRLVSVSADDIRAAAASGDPYALRLGDKDVTVVLERNEVFAPEGWYVDDISVA